MIIAVTEWGKKMNNDLISRQKVIDKIHEYLKRDRDGMNWKMAAIDCVEIVERLPSSGAVPVVRCEECVYRRSCMLQHFVESNAVDGTKIDWSEWYCADGVMDLNVPSKSDERQEK